MTVQATCPAPVLEVLGFALEQTKGDLAYPGFASMFVLAGIVKTALAQLMAAFLP
jgi:hypothetical protein